MTTENQHYCQEHQCYYKKYEKGDKSWYSHKLEDGTYCNEAKKKEQPKTEPVFKVEQEKRNYPKDEMSKNDWAEKDRLKQLSIESQQAAEYTTGLWVAGKLQDGEPEVVGLRQWIRDRLCSGYVQGKIEPLKPPASPITKAEVAKALDNVPPPGTLTVPKVGPITLAAINELLKIPENKAKISAEIKSRGWVAKKPSELSQPQASILLSLFSDDDNPPVDTNIPY